MEFGSMKILNIIEDGRYGGPQKRIAIIAAYLEKHYSVQTIVLFPKGEDDRFERELVEKNIEYHHIRSSSLKRSVGGILGFIISFWPQVILLKRKIAEHEPDLVYCSGGAWQWKGVMASYLARKPSIWHLNDTYTPLLVRTVFTTILKRFARVFVVEGEKVRNYYSSALSKKQCFVIPSPVEIDGLLFDRKYRKLKSLRVVAVGNVNPAKGYDMLLDVAEMLSYRKLPVFIDVYGSEFSTQLRYIERLKNRLSDMKLSNIRFNGSVENIPQVLKEADAYLCTSVTEASPMAVWEAMVSALPIIATDVGDVRVNMNKGTNGMVVKYGDVRSMVEGLEMLLGDEKLREMYGSNARKWSVERFSTEVIAKQHLTVYASATAG